ncbi:MAG: hypothetical protein R3F11_23840 [Verrucomicrobiales bacterium]
MESRIPSPAPRRRRLFGSAALALAVIASTARADLVAWWKFDEASGTVAEDAAGEHDAALSAGSTFSPAGAVLSTARRRPMAPPEKS